jgi:hypothetical protein
MSKIVDWDDDKKIIYVEIDNVTKELDITRFLKNPLVVKNSGYTTEDIVGTANRLVGNNPTDEFKKIFPNGYKTWITGESTIWIIDFIKVDGLYEEIKKNIIDISYDWSKIDNSLCAISVNTKD